MNPATLDRYNRLDRRASSLGRSGAFEIHFRRNYDTPKDFSKVGTCNTLEEAKALRAVSGDLVVDALTGDIVTDTGWLWDWELQDEASYAQRAIKWQKRRKP